MSAEQFSMLKFASRQDRDDAMLDEIERLWAEVAGLREDAERYREWKRAFREGECALWNALCEGQSDAEHDAAIDAALAARKGEA